MSYYDKGGDNANRRTHVADTRDLTSVNAFPQ
jgi:hypothetical protein